MINVDSFIKKALDKNKINGKLLNSKYVDGILYYGKDDNIFDVSAIKYIYDTLTGEELVSKEVNN